MGKAVKNWRKHNEIFFFLVNQLFFVSKRAINSLTLLFSKVQQERFTHSCSFLKSDMSDLLTNALFKVPCEQIAHSCSLKSAILSKRVKSKERKCEERKSKFPTLSKTNERYPFKGPYFQKNTRGKILKKVISLILSHKIGYKKVFCKPI